MFFLQVFQKLHYLSKPSHPSFFLVLKKKVLLFSCQMLSLLQNFYSYPIEKLASPLIRMLLLKIYFCHIFKNLLRYLSLFLYFFLLKTLLLVFGPLEAIMFILVFQVSKKWRAIQSIRIARN